MIIKRSKEIAKAYDLRCCIFLSIPIACTLKALAGFAEIILLLEINLGYLFLPISGLTEATGLRQMCDGL